MSEHAQPQTIHAVRPTRITSASVLQRTCACGQHTHGEGECAECRNKMLQQAAASQAAPNQAPPIVHDVLRSPGQPLDAETRAFMEPRFGHDFSQVRVHADERAADSARAVNALVYTVGHHVMFGAGQYAPGTNQGRHLLAHELTHVAQQKAISSSPGSTLPIDGAGHQSEHEAEQISKVVMTNAADVALTRSASPLNDSLPVRQVAMNATLQRQEAAVPGACVVNEQIPRNRSGLINSGGQVGERFDVAITWGNAVPPPAGVGGSYCSCRCGEYRQYVKGHLIINGVRETQRLWGGAVLEENVYHEDGRDRNPQARYGHRDEPVTMDEEFTPDRATGCSYVGRDFPRVMIGSHTDMLFQFKGQTYNTCNQTFGPIHEWEVRYVGPINR